MVSTAPAPVGTQLAHVGPTPHVLASAPARQFSFAEMQAMADQVSKSRMFPGIENAQSAMTLMLLCDADGLHPINAMRRYHVIKGRPSMRADAMQAEFQRQGGRVVWVQSDREVCRARFIHPVHAPEPGFEVEVTWEECSAAGNLDMYRKFPAPMLRARCISQGVRAVMPGVVVGIYTPEEIHANVIDVTPVENFTGPAPISPATASPAELSAGRQGVNQAFASKGSPPPAEASRYPSKEVHQLPAQRINARGVDARIWASIPSDEAEALNKSVAARCEENGLTPFVILTGEQILNHLVSEVVEALPDMEQHFTTEKAGKVKRRGPGQLSQVLGELYADKWREWLREKLGAYLALKRKAASDRIDNEVHGDAAILDADDDSQEPATPPENETQEPVPVGAGADDDAWAPGRE